MSAEHNADEERNMAPIDETNELIEYFKGQVDREALRKNLELTPAQRVEKLERLLRENQPDKPKSDPRPQTAQPLQEPLGRYEVTDSEEPPAEATNDLIEAFKKDVDRTLLIENLKLTVPQRMEQFERNMEMLYELRRGMRRTREGGKDGG
jgi:hypothetical protein